MRPLYVDLVDRAIPWLEEGGHAGLWFAKFTHHWKREGFDALLRKGSEVKSLDVFAKPAAIDEFTEKSVGDRAAIVEVTDRYLNLIEAAGGSHLFVRATSRFLTGAGQPHPTEVGFTWHPTLGTPYLPGSGVKGAVRAWAERWAGVGAAVVERVFGPRPGGALTVGSVVFFDALPTKPVKLVQDIINPHYPDWYREEPGGAPSDDQDPVPVNLLCVESDARFLFGLAPRRRGDEQDEADAVAALGWLRDLLDFVGVGAKTSAGYGRFVIDADTENATQLRRRERREAMEREAAIEREKSMRSALGAELFEEAVRRSWSTATVPPDLDRARNDFLNSESGVNRWLLRLEAEPDVDAVKQLARLCRKFLSSGIFDIDLAHPPIGKRGQPIYRPGQVKIASDCRRVMALANLTDADLE
jgi:CRISPR-associated protein Cmr6